MGGIRVVGSWKIEGGFRKDGTGALEEIVDMEGCWKGWKGGRSIGRR